MNIIETQILKQLDDQFQKHDFPSLENTDIDFITGQLIGLRNGANWALIFSWVVWWPSADGAMTLVYCYGNCIKDNIGLENHILYPVEFSYKWDEKKGDDIVQEATIRNKQINTNELTECHNAQIHNENGFKVLVNLTTKYRESMLASKKEYESFLACDMNKIIILNDWYHGNGHILPSQNKTFQQLAKVLSSSDKSNYLPTTKSNTNWKYWIPK